MNAEFFLLLDVVKAVLLKKMAREAGVVLTDTFLEPERRAQTVTLYERVGNNFVTYIKTLHRVKSPKFLLTLAANAIEVFQDNLDKCWVFAYDGHTTSINWLPIDDMMEVIIDES